MLRTVSPYVLFEGTTIDTTLVNHLNGDFAGPVKVLVASPVYSQDRQHTLIPEGTFILGDAQKVDTFGQRRLAVTFSPDADAGRIFRRPGPVPRTESDGRDRSE